MRSFTTILLAAAALLGSISSAQPTPLTGSFNVLTYNVAGLPEGLSSSKPKENTPVISQRLEEYSIVNVQEDFNYHDALLSSNKHPHLTETSGPVPFGSGLNTLSHFPFTDVRRVPWQACWFGSGDCLTPKGFTAMRVEISPGVSVDMYNLHAEAGDDTLDFMMRGIGFKQLTKFIGEYSRDRAVIVFGDTNTRYTSSKDPIRKFVGDNGLTDAWVQLEKGGNPPGTGNSIECPFPVPSGEEDNQCELIDKVLYRSGGGVQLAAKVLRNENAKFLGGGGGPLSDHFPVLVEFGWEKK